MQRELQPAEVEDLLSRQFDLNAKVLTFQRIVDSGQWDQVRQNEAQWSWSAWGTVVVDLPIPTRGLAVPDEKFGLVVVFPDAAGKLHYSADVAPAVGAAINQPPFQSPSGNTAQQILADLISGLGRIAAGLTIAGLVYVWVLKR